MTSVFTTAIVTPFVTIYGDGEVETSYKTNIINEVDTNDPNVIIRSDSFWTEFGVELLGRTRFLLYLFTDLALGPRLPYMLRILTLS